MRIRELCLKRYGHFSDHKINFGTKSCDFHIICDYNEAGKTTSQNALKDFLFGIPEKSPYTFLHEEKTSIAAILENSKGLSRYFVRTKIRGQEILDGDTNETLNEQELFPFIGSLNRVLLSSLFALSYQSLREGSSEIAKMNELGAILFASSSTLPGLNQLVEQIKNEEEEVFKKNGRRPKLNECLLKFADVNRGVNQLNRHQKVGKLENEIKTLQEHYQECEKSIESLKSEQKKVQRHKVTKPLLKRVNDFSSELSKIGPLPILCDGFDNIWKSLHQKLHNHLKQLEEINYEKKELEGKLQQLFLNSDERQIWECRDTIHQLVFEKHYIDASKKECDSLLTKIFLKKSDIRNYLQELSLSDLSEDFVEILPKDSFLNDTFALGNKGLRIQNGLELLRVQMDDSQSKLSSIQHHPSIHIKQWPSLDDLIKSRKERNELIREALKNPTETMIDLCEKKISDVDQMTDERFLYAKEEAEIIQTRKTIIERTLKWEQEKKNFDAWELKWKKSMKELLQPTDVSIEGGLTIVNQYQQLKREYSELKKLKCELSEKQTVVSLFVAKEKQLSLKLRRPHNETLLMQLKYDLDEISIKENEAKNSKREIDKLILREQKEQKYIDSLQFEIANWIKKAGNPSDDELANIVKATQKKVQLNNDYQRALAELESLNPCASLEQLQNELSQLQQDDLIALSELIEEKLNEALKLKEELRCEITKKKLLLEQRDQSSEFLKLNVEREFLKNEINRWANEAILKRTAIFMLQKAIECHRQRSQGEQVQRAASLFKRMTCDTYVNLIIEEEKGKQVLKAQKYTGELRSPKDLSDGACDQLYLALRLAALEEYAQRAEPAPFVADDLLVNFDDKRSKATLEVLGEFSKSIQVIFFTHHPHLVNIAKDNLELDSFRLHTLQRS